jgi:diguanylate cyclase (GGDEF)-like protein
MQASYIRESERLTALDRYDILDTPPEEAFDRITRLTRSVFDVSMATISLLDGHRQWFKSRQGFHSCETSRGMALCDYTIRESVPLVIPDTLADERYREHPSVTGDPHVRFYAGAQLRVTGGHNIGTLCAFDTRPRGFSMEEAAILQDLARIVLSELELRTLLMQDSLTGALSRRALRDETTRAITLATRHGHHLSLIMFDLDHFKAINDNNGHHVGDRVLAACVRAVQGMLRKADCVGRIGGEEFAVLLPHTDFADAMQVAEKIRAAIAGVVVPGAKGPIAVSASLGVAAVDRTAHDTDELIRRADVAMYEAKQAGRNRCMAWHAPNIAPDRLRRVFKAGHISFHGGASTINCTVRGLSAVGASIDVISTGDIPEHFRLIIPVDHIARNCRILGKRERHIDIAFE